MKRRFVRRIGPTFERPFHGEIGGRLSSDCSKPHASVASEVRIEAGELGLSIFVHADLNPEFRSAARCK